MKEFYLIVKCIFIGNSGVGKTSIIERYVKNNIDCKSTIGVEFYCKKVQIKNMNFKIHIWDLAGQMTYRNIIQKYYRNTAIIFFVFDKNNKQSLLDFYTWLETIQDIDKKTLVIIGNKSDLVKLSHENTKEILEILNRYHSFYFETSAKDNTNITEAFENTLKIFYDKLLLEQPNLHNFSIAQKHSYNEGVRFASDFDDIPIPPKKCC